MVAHCHSILGFANRATLQSPRTLQCSPDTQMAGVQLTGTAKYFYNLKGRQGQAMGKSGIGRRRSQQLLDHLIGEDPMEPSSQDGEVGGGRYVACYFSGDG
jgi:hypothetical protein